MKEIYIFFKQLFYRVILRYKISLYIRRKFLCSSFSYFCLSLIFYVFFFSIFSILLSVFHVLFDCTDSTRRKCELCDFPLCPSTSRIFVCVRRHRNACMECSKINRLFLSPFSSFFRTRDFYIALAIFKHCEPSASFHGESQKRIKVTQNHILQSTSDAPCLQ